MPPTAGDYGLYGLKNSNFAQRLLAHAVYTLALAADKTGDEDPRTFATDDIFNEYQRQLRVGRYPSSFGADMTREKAPERLNRLVERGILERADRSAYTITTKGMAAGEQVAKELTA